MSTPATPVPPMTGDPASAATLARTLGAMHEKTTGTTSTVQHHQGVIDQHWHSQAGNAAKAALGGAAARYRTTHHGLASAAAILHQFSASLATLQQDHNNAAARVAAAQAAIASNPADPVAQNDLHRAQAAIASTHTQLHTDSHHVARVLDSLTPPPLVATPHGQLTPIEAMLIDQAVAGGHLSGKQGARVAARMASLSHGQSKQLGKTLDEASGKDRLKAYQMLSQGASVGQITTALGIGKYFSLDGPGKKLNGRTSWFGGPNDPGAGGTPASGIPITVPGIAVFNQATLGGYWLVQFPNDKKLVLQQTDIGPAPSTNRVIDVTYSALPAAGYSQGNFPTNGTVHARFLGMHVPAGVATT